jgi:hypothetical protein
MNVGDLVKQRKVKYSVFVQSSTGVDLSKDLPYMQKNELGLILSKRYGPGSMLWIEILTTSGLKGWVQASLMSLL